MSHKLDTYILRRLSAERVKKGNHVAAVNSLKKCVMGEAMAKRYWEQQKEAWTNDPIPTS